jgi:hypothetical protein
MTQIVRILNCELPDLNSSPCPYNVYAWRAQPKVSLRWQDLRLDTRTQNDKKFRGHAPGRGGGAGD